MNRYKFIILFILLIFTLFGQAQVRFDQPHGLYEVDELTVTITPSEEGLSIHYTTDGSIPTTESPRYVAPLKLKETT